MRTWILVPLVALALGGCDKVDQPVAPRDGSTGPIASVPRKVLLEDLTGHTCNNCPEAAAMAQQLKGIYGDDLIVVGVHMTETFAAPAPPLGDDSLDTDFRTPAGNVYEQTFQPPSLPKGLISRKPYAGSLLISRSNWADAVSQIIGQEADFKVWFDSFSFNSVTHQVTATVKTLCAHPITGDHNLTVYLIEDHVIDGQIDMNATPPYVPNYDHRDVLRDNLNGTWGQALVTGSAVAGDTLTTELNYTLSANVVNPDNCALVAYVYSTQGTDQYEVKQVEERKFVE